MRGHEQHRTKRWFGKRLLNSKSSACGAARGITVSLFGVRQQSVSLHVMSEGITSERKKIVLIAELTVQGSERVRQRAG